ncbi:MAG: hypothetical protein NTX59_01800 [Elusimicrobia bacterium]|nr:hypothetical protein [Elusimicrobiota bacterium]
MRTSQLTFYIVATTDRLIRNACMKGALRLARLLKSLGAPHAAAGLLNDATRRFPVGARGDFGEKDRRIFGPHPEKLIADYAAYLKRQGRNPGHAPTHQPPQDALMARELMNARRIFDPLSKLALTSPLWGGALLFALLGLAGFFMVAGNGKAAGITGIVFFAACIAAPLCLRLRKKFLVWMTMRLFYAASRELERVTHHNRRSVE